MTNRYTEYYQAQLGGNIPVFRGGTQRGAGLGDILRGIFRFFMPIVSKGAQSLASNTFSGTMSGQPILQAAKNAIAPALSAAAGAAGPDIQRFVDNNIISRLPFGLGRPQRGSGALFSGEDGIPTDPSAIAGYKRSLPHGPPVMKQKRKKSVKSSANSLIHYNF